MGKVDNNKHIVNSSDGKSGRSGLNVKSWLARKVIYLSLGFNRSGLKSF